MIRDGEHKKQGALQDCSSQENCEPFGAQRYYAASHSTTTSFIPQQLYTIYEGENEDSDEEPETLPKKKKQSSRRKNQKRYQHELTQQEQQLIYSSGSEEETDNAWMPA